MRQTHPGLVADAVAEDPAAPPLFFEFNASLPPFTASGLPPSALAGLPWQLRRPVAAAATLQNAYAIAERADDEVFLNQVRYEGANRDFVAATQQWLIGSGHLGGSEADVRAAAEGDDPLYQQLFGEIDRRAAERGRTGRRK